MIQKKTQFSQFTFLEINKLFQNSRIDFIPYIFILTYLATVYFEEQEKETLIQKGFQLKLRKP